MILPALYHWSPSERRDDVLRQGLLPYSRPVAHSGPESYPYISLGTTSSKAWGLSGDLEWLTDFEEWDLWQVRLSDTDSVHIRPEFGDEVWEVKVANAIMPDRIWYVATREPLSAKEIKPKTKPRKRRKKT